MDVDATPTNRREAHLWACTICGAPWVPQSDDPMAFTRSHKPGCRFTLADDLGC